LLRILYEAIIDRAKDQCDLIWLENLNLRGGFKKTIMDYIAEKHPDLTARMYIGDS